MVEISFVFILDIPVHPHDDVETFSALLAIFAFTKASDADLWCFLWSAPEQKFEWTIEAPVIRDAIVLIMTSL